MTSQTKYGDHDKDDKDVEAGKPVADKPGVWKPPAKMPTQDAWRVTQGALNSLGLADPYLKVDGIPGPETLKVAQGLVPLIQYVMKQT